MCSTNRLTKCNSIGSIVYSPSDMSDSFIFESLEEDIPMLSDGHSSGSSIANSSNILEESENRHHSVSKKIKHNHYMLYQKRYNKLIFSIKYMKVMDKIKLKYIS